MENNELIMNEEFEDINVVEDYESPKASVGGIIGVCAAVAAVAGGVALYLHKTKDKREAKKIEKLRKKGYVILTPEEVEQVKDSEVVEVEEHE